MTVTESIGYITVLQYMMIFLLCMAIPQCLKNCTCVVFNHHIQILRYITHYSRPSVIQPLFILVYLKLGMTVLLEYFEYKGMFY